MKQLSKARLRLTLWCVVAMALVVMTAGTLFAAGEQLERGATLSGGNTRSSNGFVIRDVIGLYVSGSSVSSPSGIGLCSGFGCDVRSNVDPDDPDDVGAQLFMPRLRR